MLPCCQPDQVNASWHVAHHNSLPRIACPMNCCVQTAGAATAPEGPRTKHIANFKPPANALSCSQSVQSFASSSDDGTPAVSQGLMNAAMFLLRDTTLVDPEAEVSHTTTCRLHDAISAHLLIPCTSCDHLLIFTEAVVLNVFTQSLLLWARYRSANSELAVSTCWITQR